MRVSTLFARTLRDDPAVFTSLSPAQIEAVINRYAEWRTSRMATGQVVGGSKLRDGSGKVLSGGAVTDLGLPGGADGGAVAINDAGQTVGVSGLPTRFVRAVAESQETPFPLTAAGPRRDCTGLPFDRGNA